MPAGPFPAFKRPPQPYRPQHLKCCARPTAVLRKTHDNVAQDSRQCRTRITGRGSNGTKRGLAPFSGKDGKGGNVSRFFTPATACRLSSASRQTTHSTGNLTKHKTRTPCLFCGLSATLPVPHIRLTARIRKRTLPACHFPFPYNTVFNLPTVRRISRTKTKRKEENSGKYAEALFLNRVPSKPFPANNRQNVSLIDIFHR